MAPKVSSAIFRIVFLNQTLRIDRPSVYNGDFEMLAQTQITKAVCLIQITKP